MKIGAIPRLMALVVLNLVGIVRADDLVGLQRVSVPSNDVGGAIIPFVPFDDNEPNSYLSGPFMGNGVVSQSDVLRLISPSSGLEMNAVYTNGVWRDVASGEQVAIKASLGDIVLIDPLDDMPFDFFIFGYWRHLLFPVTSAYPRFVSMSVDAGGRFAELGVASDDRLIDFIKGESEDLSSGLIRWYHAGRERIGDSIWVWREPIFSAGPSNILFAVTDAGLDTDGDGVPDAVERYEVIAKPRR